MQAFVDISRYDGFRFTLCSDTAIIVNRNSVVKVPYSIYLHLKGSSVPPTWSAGCITLAPLSLVSFFQLPSLYSFLAIFGERSSFLRHPGSQSEGHRAFPLPSGILPRSKIG